MTKCGVENLDDGSVCHLSPNHTGQHLFAHNLALPLPVVVELEDGEVKSVRIPGWAATVYIVDHDKCSDGDLEDRRKAIREASEAQFGTDATQFRAVDQLLFALLDPHERDLAEGEDMADDWEREKQSIENWTRRE